MSYSPNSDILRRTIDLNYADKKRATSLKWISVNGVIFLLFFFDLWGKCEGYTSPLHYVELACAGVAAANLLHHALRIARPRRAAAERDLLRRRLQGLSDSRLDSSVNELSRSGSPGSIPAGDESAAEALSLSLSSAGRAWRSSSGSPRSPPSPPSPPSPHSPHSPSPHDTSPLSRYDRDEFIATRSELADYLRYRGDRSRGEAPSPGWGAAGAGAGGPGGALAQPLYQLAALETENKCEEGAGGGGGAGAGGAGSPQLWRRLQLDPQRLTQFNLNLRLWIHMTILQRVVREMRALDAAFAAHGLPDVRIGEVPAERLRKMAAHGFPALGALLPFLEPFADQRYVAQRYRELTNGGCLSEYKWNGGGADWDESRPTDAELVLHAFAAYLDAQLPALGGACAGGAGGFSARHVSAAPAAPARGPHALALHRTARIPPHYVLVRGEETVEVGAGRNNLLHCLLLLIGLCAAQEPPALQRLHLGPAGLNLLWVLGR